MFILYKYLNIQYSYRRYCAYVLTTDTPSCPKSWLGPGLVPGWVPGGSRLGPGWVWLAHKDREILENVNWEIDNVPK